MSYYLKEIHNMKRLYQAFKLAFIDLFEAYKLVKDLLIDTYHTIIMIAKSSIALYYVLIGFLSLFLYHALFLLIVMRKYYNLKNLDKEIAIRNSKKASKKLKNN